MDFGSRQNRTYTQSSQHHKQVACNYAVNKLSVSETRIFNTKINKYLKSLKQIKNTKFNNTFTFLVIAYCQTFPFSLSKKCIY